MNETKEVRFDIWCSTCEHRDKNETEDPCNECLAQGWNADSTKPLMYKEAEKK